MTKWHAMLMGSGFLVILAFCFWPGPRIEEVTLIDQPFVLGTGWMEVPLPSGVKSTWLVQSVLSKVGDAPLPVTFDEHPEMELISEDGTGYKLDAFGLSLPGGMMNDSLDIPRGKRFVRLRMRSPRQLWILRVVWRSYMPEDFKEGII